ncbi:MAG: DnaD domain protein [Anaerolineae bacterium]|nr:DnaD domain protein [Anaerolineae bacterium]
MDTFNGFVPGKMQTITIPAQFFSDLLPIISDLVELKVTLYCFWALHQREGEFRYVIRREVLQDQLLLSGIDPDTTLAAEKVTNALQQATIRGTLLHAQVEGANEPEDLYFMNTARGRNALKAIEAGHFQFGGQDCPVALVVERPNIYTLYEENIGPLTPMIGEQLRDAEQEFPAEWIKEAIQIAVERNTRNWRYVMGILKRWQSEGKDRGLIQQPIQADGKRFISGERSHIIKY